VEPTEGEIDVETTTIDTNGNNGDVVPEDDTTDSDATDESVESDEVQTDDPEEQERRRVYEELMEVDSVKEAKQTWKQTNPNENLKTYKELYIKGKIDNLPWLEDVDTIPDTKNRFFYPQEVEQEYVQNAEQTDNSLWKDINKK
jgi:alkylated DNA repair dioxygenase AlkB